MFLALMDGGGEPGPHNGGDSDSEEDELACSPSSSSRDREQHEWGKAHDSDASDSDEEGSGSVEQQGADVAAIAVSAVPRDCEDEEAGLILATRTLEISLSADNGLSSAPTRSVAGGPLTSLVGSREMLRPLKPVSTDTSRTAPLPRRSIPNRSSTIIGYGHMLLPHDVVPLLNEQALLSALSSAAAMLEQRGLVCAQHAHEALLQAERLSLSSSLPDGSTGALESARRVLHAARTHSPLAATIVVHYARWSESEENAQALCSGDGLEVLLALLEYRAADVREPACKSFANLCAMPQGASALGNARTVDRICGAVRAHLGRQAATVLGGGGGGLGGGGLGGLGADDTADSAANLMRGFKKLALTSEGRLALAMGGALQLVTEVSRAHPTASAVVEQALRIVGNVAIDPEREATIVESGCVQ
ncbi:hypothetical protein T492DRAFT_884800, partial [Pavlovales sp. CCMP2436]